MIFDYPGLLTDAANPRCDEEHDGAQFFWDCGYRLICQQAVNQGDTNNPDEYVKAINLDKYRQRGFGIGPWGVTYDKRWFWRDGAALAQVAKDMNADFLMIDAEYAIESGEDPTLLLDALDAYKGPKALTTLGAAYPPYVFPIQYAKFIERDYHIMPQAYASWDWMSYNPKWCLEHAQKAGIPLDRVHLMMDASSEYQSLEKGGTGRPTSSADIIQWLADAKYATPDIWIFMAEYNTDQFYIDLKAVTMRTTPPDPRNPTETRNEMLKLGRAQESRWKALGYDENRIEKQRIGMADRVLSLSDIELTRLGPAIRKVIYG